MDEEDEDWIDSEAEGEEDFLACPDCGMKTFAEAEACAACGYWFTDADHTAAWKARSKSGQIVTLGLWALGIAAGAALALWVL